jgi:hypothetical protein
MSHDPAAAVAAAATRTMCGSARVGVACWTSVPEYEGRVEYSGPADFDGDRCRLVGAAHAGEGSAAPAIVCDGPVLYTRQEDGRWTWTRGRPGAHSMFDPRWTLEALVHGQRSAVATADAVVELALDYDTLNAGTDLGLARDWDESTAVARLSPGGRIAHATLTLRSRDHLEAWIRIDCQISEPVAPCTIGLPGSESTISLRRWLEQAGDSPDAESPRFDPT